MLIANRYRAKTALAAGGMGDILECVDTHLDRTVVLKTLQSGVESRRLLDEQKALAKLRSKHVVQLFDIVEVSTKSGKTPALVLEHINGSDLQPHSYNPKRKFLRTLWQISCGLSDIHEAGVIHRDIKPANIRMDSEGVIKILDFGLARSKGVDDQTRSVIGTPIYMAPELWGRATISFSSAVDVYAFGVTALALLKTALPDAVRGSPPLPVSEAQMKAAMVGIAPDLVELFASCLAANPKDRPEMKEVAKALSTHLLHNQHRALLIVDNRPVELSSASKGVTVRAGLLGTIAISYDGFVFAVTQTSGSVFINNKTAIVGQLMPGSCVITIGTGGNRKFVTFDLSNPEVAA